MRGRAFTDADGEQAPAWSVVNETLAARLFPGDDPIGRRSRHRRRPGRSLVDDRRRGRRHPPRQPRRGRAGRAVCSTTSASPPFAPFVDDPHVRRSGGTGRLGAPAARTIDPGVHAIATSARWRRPARLAGRTPLHAGAGRAPSGGSRCCWRPGRLRRRRPGGSRAHRGTGPARRAWCGAGCGWHGWSSATRCGHRNRPGGRTDRGGRRVAGGRALSSTGCARSIP